MSSSHKIEKVINYIKTKRTTFFNEEEEVLPPHVAIKDTYINAFSRVENSVKILFDVVNVKILQVSNNVEAISGYSEKEILQGNLILVLKFLTFEHFLFPHTWVKWITGIYEKTGNLDNLKVTCCGVKMKHKLGHEMCGIIQYTPVEILNNLKDGVSKTAIMTITDISHLMKSDFYWLRAEFGLDNKCVHHLLSIDKNDNSRDIISDREKEVLRLIAQGLDSKGIGKILFASPHTIDNHRRKMLTKTGARDTTALVQICRMCGII
jgi:DNA-binding CsgD family transcriptional regulator